MQDAAQLLAAAGSRGHRPSEYLFELAPLGPGDLLPRCREGPGNWWGEGNEDLRVDAKGQVVLVDPEIYYEVCCGGKQRDMLMYTRLFR